MRREGRYVYYRSQQPRRSQKCRRISKDEVRKKTETRRRRRLDRRRNDGDETYQAGNNCRRPSASNDIRADSMAEANDWDLVARMFGQFTVIRRTKEATATNPSTCRQQQRYSMSTPTCRRSTASQHPRSSSSSSSAAAAAN